MYTDSHKLHEFVSAVAAQAGIQIEVEATAGICRRVGAILDTAAAVPVGSVAIDAVRCSVDVDLVSFGVVLTEALTNAHATHCVVALKAIDKEGGTTTTVATITLPKDSTEVTPSTQTSPNTSTAAQAVAIGARLFSTDLDVPYRVKGGGTFYVEVTVAAGAAGGAFRPFVATRVCGGSIVQGTTTSPVTKLAV